MSKATSILLGDDFEAYIDSQITAEPFNSAIEVVEAGLKALKEEDELEAFRAALNRGRGVE